ncbi:MAG: T9SS type A sorting domain-containing protein [Sphingobacteriales bacterium]|nr:T9SS type A sorting domain-containing protein [Sphingobacteriales bacterium]
MKNILNLLFAVFINGHVYAQLQIAAGTSWRSNSSTFVVLDNTAFQYDAATASLGNTFKFTGNADVTIAGAGLPILTNIILAKTGSAKLILQRDINLTQSLDFQGGLCDLNGFDIFMGTNALLNNESESSRIMGTDGFVRIINTLNAPNAANPGNLGAVISSSQNLGSTSIYRGVKSQTNGSNAGNSILRYYDIVPAGNTGLNATLRFHYFDAELNGLAESTLDMYKSTNGTNWVNVGFSSRDVVLNYVEKTGIDAFSRWTLSTAGNALPLRFLLFNVRCNANIVTVNWKTAQEFNTGHFEIQRATNGVNWITIGNLQAAGSSASEQNYSFTDNNPLPNGAMYRVSEVDKDGKTYYTSIIRNECGRPDLWKVWPNPVQEQLYVNIRTTDGSAAVIKIYDSKGTLVKKQLNQLLPGSNQINIDMSRLPAGVYNVEAEWGNGQSGKTAMIIKQ